MSKSEPKNGMNISASKKWLSYKVFLMALPGIIVVLLFYYLPDVYKRQVNGNPECLFAWERIAKELVEGY